MSRRVRPLSLLVWCAVTLLAAGCRSSSDGPDYASVLPASTPVCDPSIVIEKDSPALLVTDPAALQRFTLSELLTRSGVKESEQLPLVQRLFDTYNSGDESDDPGDGNCDSPNNVAFLNWPAATCPRPEGALAASTGFFKKGHPDHFYPVAIVNRLDLMPLFGSTCGEVRFIYAKESGLTDPNNRVFLIFEGAVTGGGDALLGGCHKIGRFWKSLEEAGTPEELGDQLHAFMFKGVNGMQPAVDETSFGGFLGGTTYYGTAGQVRMSVHVGEHWEMRQFGLRRSADIPPVFVPLPVGNNALPRLFDIDSALDEETVAWFQSDFYNTQLDSLASPYLMGMSMRVSAEHLSGESAMGGPEKNDYVARAIQNRPFMEKLAYQIEAHSLNDACPTDDPLTPDSIVRRAEVQTCAGCHSPRRFLGSARSLGCGLTWPDSLGDVHIDERGQISPALRDVFLPHRAEVLTRYLQACDTDAVVDALEGKTDAPTTKSLDMTRTLGGSRTH
ncbi:MAG: hypothetical protein R3B70_39195 [Polyangiaceae bacterium]